MVKFIVAYDPGKRGNKDPKTGAIVNKPMAQQFDEVENGKEISQE